MNSRYDSVPAHVARWADKEPGRPLIAEVDGTEATYGEFHHEVLRWATGLRTLGLGAGDNVVTIVPNSVTSSCAWLGLSWLRARHVGLHAALHGQALTYQMNDSEAETAIVDRRFLGQLADVADSLDRLRTVIVPNADGEVPELPWRTITGEELLSGAEPAGDLEPPRRHDICAIMYTSGTTGMPKGVLVPWGLAETGARSTVGDLAGDDCYYAYYPLFHLAGVAPFASVTKVGGRIVLRERFDMHACWQDINEYGITFATMVPAMANWLLGLPERPEDADNPLRNVIMAPVIPRVAEFSRRFGVRVRTGYGMTEAGSPLNSAYHIESPTVGAGRPSEGYECRLVNELDYEVPRGETGELIIRSDEPWTLMAGYHRLPEATARAWRNGWFHTGDAFREDEEGNYHFVDRKKDAIRRRGELIASFQVEALVVGHQDVAECAAVGIDAEEGEQELKVVVVPRPDADLTPADLHEYLVENMPRFMVPRYIEIVDTLPKTAATLRVQKGKLRQNTLTPGTWDRKAAGVKLPK